jgi:hypothetical protein
VLESLMCWKSSRSKGAKTATHTPPPSMQNGHAGPCNAVTQPRRRKSCVGETVSPGPA